MLLHDLYRYRPTDGRDPREAWLTSCLGELLAVDDKLRSAVMSELGSQASTAVKVDHQRRLGEHGHGSQVADLVLETDEHFLLLECKDRDAPKLTQMLGYAQLIAAERGPIVALVAGEAAVSAIRQDRRWSGFPSMTWQQLYKVGDPAAVEDPHVRWFRQNFRHLLEQFDLQPLRDVTPEEVVALQRHWRKLEARRRELRDGVTALLTQRTEPPEEAWVEDNLEVWWETERKHPGLPVKGLGLCATPTARGALEFWLSILPGSATKAKALGEAGLRPDATPGWWSTKLFRGDRDGKWQADVMSAVLQGRSVLRALGLSAGQAEFKKNRVTQTAELVAIQAEAERTNGAIWAAQAAIKAGLASRLGVQPGRRFVGVQRDGKDGVLWARVETAKLPLVEVRLGPAIGPNDRRFATIAAWFDANRAAHPRVLLQRIDEVHVASFSVDLAKHGLHQAVASLVGVVAALVEAKPKLHAAGA